MGKNGKRYSDEFKKQIVKLHEMGKKVYILLPWRIGQEKSRKLK